MGAQMFRTVQVAGMVTGNGVYSNQKPPSQPERGFSICRDMLSQNLLRNLFVFCGPAVAVDHPVNHVSHHHGPYAVDHGVLF